MYYGDNPAARLYQREGFRPFEVTGVKKLASNSIALPQLQAQALRQSIDNQTVWTAGEGKKQYNIAKLVELIKQHKLKPQEIDIQNIRALTKKLDNVWGNKIYKTQHPLTVRYMAQEHLPRIIQSDLSYPILVNQRGTRVYNGVHRLMKAILLNKKKIKAYRVPRSYFEQLQESAQNIRQMKDD